MRLRICLVGLLIAACGSITLPQRRPGAPAGGTARTVTIVSEPSAVVWIDEIRRGTTDAGGKLAQLKVLSGAHTLRVRANGFRETTIPLTCVQRSEIRVRLLRTTDEAELSFQQAETARETAKDEAGRQKAA